MNQMERIVKTIVTEPDKDKKRRMKAELDQLFYLKNHYGKVPRTHLSKELGIPKYQLNQIIIENKIIAIDPLAQQTGKAAQNRRAYPKRKESVK